MGRWPRERHPARRRQRPDSARPGEAGEATGLEPRPRLSGEPAPGGATAVVFDLGGVLIDWNPRYLYRSLFDGDDEAMERFLVEICSPEWNHRQDAGRPWAEAIAELVARFPAERDRIVAYRERWVEMLGGVFDDTLAIVDELRASGAVRLFALTNWSAETYAIARDRFPFLAWFEAVVVSGELGIAKPDPAIFRYLLERHDLDARSTIYVDDLEPNVAAARRLGLRSVRFEDATTLRRRLVAEGVLEARRPA